MSKYLTPCLLAALLAAGCGSGPNGTLIVGDDDDAVGDDDDAVGDDDDAVGDDDDAVGDDDDDTQSLAGFYLGGMMIFGGDGDAFCEGDGCFEVTDAGRLVGLALCPFGGGGGGGGNPFEFSGAISSTGDLDEGVATYERFGQTSEYEVEGGIDLKSQQLDISWEMSLGGGGGGGFDVSAEAWGNPAPDLDSCEGVVGSGDDDDDNGGGPGGGGGN